MFTFLYVSGSGQRSNRVGYLNTVFRRVDGNVKLQCSSFILCIIGEENEDLCREILIKDFSYELCERG